MFIQIGLYEESERKEIVSQWEGTPVGVFMPTVPFPELPFSVCRLFRGKRMKVASCLRA